MVLTAPRELKGHTNLRPFDPNTGNVSRNGSISGTFDHYEFPGGV